MKFPWARPPKSHKEGMLIAILCIATLAAIITTVLITGKAQHHPLPF